MPKLISLPKYNKGNVFEAVQQIAESNTQAVFILDHCELRMQERNITRVQVIRTLRQGTLTEPPVWDSEHEKGWRCRVSHVTAGTPLTVVAKLIENADDELVLVITAWS